MTNAPIITLTTDWGLTDHYIAAVKGSLLKLLPNATIVDISHNITPYDINHTSYVIKNSWHYFPEGTIHIIGVNTEASTNHPHTAVYYEGHYFIGADNGIFSLIFDHDPEQIIELELMLDSQYFTFSTRDIFIKAAAHLAQNKPLDELGKPHNQLVQRISFQPVIDQNTIIGKIIYTDNFGNLITNITEKHFKEMVAHNNIKFEISFRGGYRIRSIRTSYDDVPEGELVAVFGSNQHLEIAINKGNAGALLGMETDDTIRIERIE